MRQKLKVAILRGPGLSKWEMQIYEPLTDVFDIVGIGTTKPVNDIAGIKFPIVRLFCPGQILAKIPKSIPAMFKIFGDTQWLLGFSKAVEGVDLIHSVELRNAYTVQAVRAKKAKLVKAVTLTVYENIPFIYDEFAPRRRIKNEVIENANHFLAINEMARQALLLEGVPENKISIVPQSVDTKVFRPKKNSESEKLAKIRKEFGIEKNDFLVLSVGRMVWEKGWYDVISAAAKIKAELGGRIKFLIVGEGPERGQIKNLIKRLRVLDTVILPGFIPYAAMPDVFRAADIFLYASLPTRFWNAQFGGVLIEAMATGIPVVGTLSGGTRDDTVGAAGGIFIQPQHFSGLVKAIARLWQDSKLVKKISERNRKMAVKRYDVQVVAKRIGDIWEKVLEGAL